MTQTHYNVPMHERRTKFNEDLDADACLKLLRELQEKYPEKSITRNFFRNETNVSDSTWNRFFGTFQEYRRQAGLEYSRQVHHHERRIAKHASVDHYREMNVRHGWSEDYLKPSGKTYQTILSGSDFHDEECDPFFLRTFIDTAKRVQPDIICLNGDIFDLHEFGKYSIDPRQWDVVGKIKFTLDNILKPLREVCPDAQIDFIEANHEARLIRHLADATPAMRSVLADLHGWDTRKLFGLDQFEINYISKANLGAWTKAANNKEVAKNYRVYFDRILAHHFPYAASWGLPGFNGHCHRYQVHYRKDALKGGYNWVEMGAGHILDASYCEGEFWTQGFMLTHINTQTKNHVFEYIPVDEFAVVGGKYYERQEHEKVGKFSGT